MERAKKKSTRKQKRTPRVPIKTYKWEDVRRDRLRGGYPWTYLYKQPFNEFVDPKDFSMESLPQSKSTSTLKSSEYLDLEVQEVSSQGSVTPEPSGYVIITDVPSDSENHSNANLATGSVIIQEEREDEPEVINLESAESSDNISQYLDKDEPLPVPQPSLAEPSNGARQQDRAKSEEPPKRKRKLSMESSYSRKSLSKLAIMKRLKEAKEKIKVPKFFKSEEKKENEVKAKPTTVAKSQPRFNKLNDKPVYIHIPLKPPEGQTDEFSYLEFGEKKPEVEAPEPTVETSETVEKKEAEPKPEPEGELQVPIDLSQRRFSGDPNEIVAIEILKAESFDLDDATRGNNGHDAYNLIQQQQQGDDVVAIILPSDEPEPSKLVKRNSSRKRAKSAEPTERKRKLSIDSSYSRKSMSKLGQIKKSLKGFKLSNLSLPKLNRSDSKKLKKGDEVKVEKKPLGQVTKPKYIAPIHIPLKPPPGQTDEFSHLEFEEMKQPVEPTSTTKEKKVEEQESIDAPESVQDEKDVQMIVLTPPSDDEILDSPDVPETPLSTDDKTFFTTKVEELKIIAKDAIEEVSPESKRKKLAILQEESASAKVDDKTEETNNTTEQTDNKTKDESEKMVIDEEDGLKLTESAMAKNEQNVKAKDADELEVKDDQKLKKKVSFKRRSRDESNKDGIYEDIQAPSGEKTKNITDDQKTKLAVLGTSQSMSVDEEKSYLDDQKIIKSTSLEEDYNRWSKLSPPPVMESAKPAKPTYVNSKKRRKRTGSLDGGSGTKNRSFSEGRPRAPRNRNVSRESSTGSSAMSLDVRCGCQYFQSDALLPDRINPIGMRPSSRTSNLIARMGDHEYEPVNPPPDDVPPPAVHVTDTDRQNKPITSTASSTTSLERRMLGGGEPPERENYTAQEMQSQIEDKFFVKSVLKKSPSPRASPSPAKMLKETPSPQESAASSAPKESKLQAFKAQAGKFKTKLHNIKKPHINLPARPKFDKLKFERPKFKMPEAPKISLPTFSLPRKKPQQRQDSTESNAGDSRTSYFDFRTYPRIFRKKSKGTDDFEDVKTTQREEFATVPRVAKRNKEPKSQKDRWGGRDSIRIPLHAQDSLEQEQQQQQREDSVERRMQEAASRIRYDQDIDIDDAYEKENQAIHSASPFSNNYNSRWNHGSFHPEPNREEMELNLRNREYKVTDLDSPEERSRPVINESFDTNTSKEIHSSESSLGIHRRGVLEEIDSDEFFLRQKGISQDNIEIGTYLSSEIREAFKSPSNALSDMQRDSHIDYEVRSSNQSLPETPSKRKSIKKPKRKKTPHVSSEQISYDLEDSEADAELFPPSRPKRRSKRRKKPAAGNVVPYQETIDTERLDAEEIEERMQQQRMQQQEQTYENEQMEGKVQPDITVTDPYADYAYESEEEEEEEPMPKPSVPPRRRRSIKSLNYSEQDSILGDFDHNREVSTDVDIIYTKEHEYIIPTPELPPVKPPRTLSRSSSQHSRDQEEPPVAPKRTRSRSRTRSQPDAEPDNVEEPCVEEPCVQQVCDYMGYATVDKNQKREPPLPPPRTPPRRKKLQSKVEQRFFTVPRPLNDAVTPVRPLRSYSTLGPSRPPRRKPSNMTDEEKENIDITQYFEIDEETETNRDLQSGEVIQKMRDRPLPAPPRPPRKTGTLRIDKEQGEQLDQDQVSEETVWTQTEPLPDDFVCEEVKQEETDTVMTPSMRRSNGSKPEAVKVERRLITPTQYSYEEETITHGSLVVEPLNGARILPDSQMTREVRIPIQKDDDYDETSEIPEEFTKLRDPPVHRQQAPQVIERIIERPVSAMSTGEVDVLKAQKLQVGDLDVDRLSVNELMAGRIIVSEIDSGNILTSEISSKTGALKVGELELPASVVQQLFDKLQEATRGPSPSVGESSSAEPGQKKTPIEQRNVKIDEIEIVDVEPERVQESPAIEEELLLEVEVESHMLKAEPCDDLSIVNSETTSLNTMVGEDDENEAAPRPPVRSDSVDEAPDAPKRPPRQPKREESFTDERLEKLEEEIEKMEQEVQRIIEPEEAEKQAAEPVKFEEPEVDDEPPPRPPHPRESDLTPSYSSSQPPASFYALRAQHFVEDFDGDIPLVPHRRRHHKQQSHARSRSKSSSSDEESVPPPTRRRHRTPEAASIPQLASQLVQACGQAANTNFKRLITHITNNVLRNADGKQDLHVMIVILLVLIAGLILLGFGDGKTVHHHHWEFFNPPRDM